VRLIARNAAGDTESQSFSYAAPQPSATSLGIGTPAYFHRQVTMTAPRSRTFEVEIFTWDNSWGSIECQNCYAAAGTLSFAGSTPRSSRPNLFSFHPLSINAAYCGQLNCLAAVVLPMNHGLNASGSAQRADVAGVVLTDQAGNASWYPSDGWCVPGIDRAVTGNGRPNMAIPGNCTLSNGAT
jgi:hypothetical protein